MGENAENAQASLERDLRHDAGPVPDQISLWRRSVILRHPTSSRNRRPDDPRPCCGARRRSRGISATRPPSGARPWTAPPASALAVQALRDRPGQDLTVVTVLHLVQQGRHFLRRHRQRRLGWRAIVCRRRVLRHRLLGRMQRGQRRLHQRAEHPGQPASTPLGPLHRVSLQHRRPDPARPSREPASPC